MSKVVHYLHCPVCGSSAINIVMHAVDHTVSHESFAIAECSSCTLRFTQDVPDADSIHAYYKSEDYISHTNTSKGLINRLYQLVRKRTMTGKRNLIQTATKKKTGALLDVGSGVGSFVNEMKIHGWNVTGLEPDEDARVVSKKLYGIELAGMDTFYGLVPAQFDAITLWHVLEHVHELKPYVQQLKNVLKPAGRIFIAVPNYTSSDATKYGEAWAAYDVPRHLYHFSPRSVKTLMEACDLEIEEYKPMWYDSFYISLLSSKYKHGKSNLPGAFTQGLRSNIKAMSDTTKCSSVIYVIKKKGA